MGFHESFVRAIALSPFLSEQINPWSNQGIEVGNPGVKEFRGRLRGFSPAWSLVSLFPCQQPSGLDADQFKIHGFIPCPTRYRPTAISLEEEVVAPSRSIGS